MRTTEATAGSGVMLGKMQRSLFLTSGWSEVPGKASDGRDLTRMGTRYK